MTTSGSDIRAAHNYLPMDGPPAGSAGPPPAAPAGGADGCSELVYGSVRGAILAGRLRPGERLRLAALTERHGVVELALIVVVLVDAVAVLRQRV